MNQELLEQLKKISPEEQRILSGEQEIEKELYMSNSDNVVDAARLLEAGKMIQVRTHTRFIHFPAHKHNYVEVIYMCSGSTHHIINGTDVILNQGELLFLNQNAVQEIFPAGENDIAVNFIILPEFFTYALQMMATEENLLRSFVIESLQGKNDTATFLHFRVSEVLPIQNLTENLIWTIFYKQQNKRSINQVTMGLLFLQLMNYMDRLNTGRQEKEQKLMFQVLAYIEENYREGQLSELAEQLHYDLYWLSREIKRQSGRNYTDLVQLKRLNQAAYLLTHTGMSVMEIGLSVGYDNLSYFHRIFQKRFGTTPRKYRLEF